MRITVNGQFHNIRPDAYGVRISYDVVSGLAGYLFPLRPTVTCRIRDRSWELVPGQDIEVTHGMIFNVAETGAT